MIKNAPISCNQLDPPGRVVAESASRCTALKRTSHRGLMGKSHDQPTSRVCLKMGEWDSTHNFRRR